MSRVYSTLVTRVLFLAFLVVMVGAAPALATPVTWNLEGAWYFSDVYQGTISGNFTYDPSKTPPASPIANWDLTVTLGSEKYIVKTGDGSTSACSIQAGGSDLIVSSFDLYGGLNNPSVQISLGYLYSQYGYLTDLKSKTLDDNFYVSAVVLNLPEEGIIRSNWTRGELVAVPLPPSAFLLATGLLGLVGWRRSRKA